MKPLGKIGRVVVLFAMAAGASAQSTPALIPVEPENPPLPSPAVPFAPVTPDAAENAEVTESLIAGQSALGLGVYSSAINSFLDALTQPNLDQNTRDTLNLNLATAYLAQGDAVKAAAALKAVSASGTPAYLLRDALCLEREGKWVEATAQLVRVDPASLAAADQPWFYLAQATLAEQHQDLAGATAAWTQASATAVTSLQKAQFDSAAMRAKILLDPSAALAAAPDLEKNLKDPNLDSALGAEDARLLAVIYDNQGRRSDALALLSTKLMLVDLNRQSLDALRLEYVILDQEDPSTANAADDQAKLKNILDDWPDQNAPDVQAITGSQERALAILENGLADKAGSPSDQLARLKDLKTYIDEKAADPRGHPLLKQLYLLQTQLDLALQQYPAAALAAQHILDLPPTPDRDLAREGAWRTLAFVAWNSTPKKYREATSNLLALHKALPDSFENKTITALLADLYFLNGETDGDPADYLNAAGYYTSLIDAPPLTISRGTLLVRAIESQLKANQPNDAITLLDQTVGRYADISPDDRWSAEFNILMALRDHDRANDAFNRLAHMLDASHGLNLMDKALRLRLRWLDATLAVEESDPSATDKAKLLKEEAEAVSAHELAADGLLLEMQAAAQAGQPDQEAGFFTALQASYKDTDAAVDAQFIIAHELAAKNNFADAQKLMKNLADPFEDFEGAISSAPPGAKYAPTARYEEAQNAYALERSTGQYADALYILKQFSTAYTNNPLYAGSPLIYNVRFMQGKLELESNDFSAAKEYFDELLEMLKDRPRSDLLVASTLMARAQCLVTLATLPDGDVAARRAAAIEELEGLFNKSELPAGARVQAGVQWGALLALDDAGADKAAKVYFQVIQEFLLGDPALAKQLDNDPNGRAIMAKCIFELGKLKESQGLSDEARRLYQLVIDYHLGPDEYAQYLINSLRAPPPSVPANAPPVAPAPASAPASAGTASSPAVNPSN